MADNGAADVTSDEVRQAVRKAIRLNEYLLRRVWGVLYLALALSMFLSFFGGPILDSLARVKSLEGLGTLSMDMTASGCAIVAILWAFKRVRNSAALSQHEGDRTWSTLLGFRLIVPLWISINAAVITTIVLARAQVPLVLQLVHVGLTIYLYYALRLSFSKKIPGEAVIAIASLCLSGIASMALFSITANHAPYALLWGATIIAWIFSGVYARTRPIPEFEEERTGLE
jgi:heme/copper-type cytochrome/quinol oxidase subunit 4